MVIFSNGFNVKEKEAPSALFMLKVTRPELEHSELMKEIESQPDDATIKAYIAEAQAVAEVLVDELDDE